MFPIPRTLFFLFLMSGILWGCNPPLKPSLAANPYIDNHAHLIGPASRDVLVDLLDKLGEPIRARDTLVYTADDLIHSMDSSGVHKSIVLSSGYLMDHFLEDGDRLTYQKVKQENDWIAGQCLKYSDRLLPFCGVNPLREYAVAEIQRCVSEQGMKGLKLHFTNSGVRLTDPIHVHSVRKVFRVCDSLELPILVHLRTAEDYSEDEARIFVDQLMGSTRRIPVVLAHLGGWGMGYDSITWKANQVIIKALRKDRDLRSRLYLDLSAVVVPDTSKHYQEGQHDLIIKTMKDFGLDRMVGGTDFPMQDHRQTREYMHRYLKLDSLVIEEILKREFFRPG